MEIRPCRKRGRSISADKKTTARVSRRFDFFDEGYSSESPPFVTLAA